MSNMIVCPEPHAASAGRDIFDAGGNAMDSSIAAAFVQTVVNPLSCGIGGSGLIHHYDGATGESTIINCRASIGSRPIPKEWEGTGINRIETVGRYLVPGHANNLGYKAVMTPGFVRGCWEAFQRFASGRFTWSELLAPAIQLAQDGFILSADDASFWDSRATRSMSSDSPDSMEAIRVTPEAERIYLNSGARYDEGDRLVQADLAQLIERLADAGAEDFYVGDIAAAIAHDFAKHDGFITADDLREYSVDIHKPLYGSYRGHKVVSPPFSSGPQVIEMLKILEHFDLAALGHNTPAYIDTVARIQRATFSDIVRLKGRSFQEEEALVPEMISDQHASYWADRISRGERIHVEKGVVTEGTTHLNCVGKDGSSVGFTHSIGGTAGAGVVTPGLGFLYNNFLVHYNPHPGFPDSIEPRKKMSGGPPTIVLRDGKPYIAIGAPGGSRQPTSICQAITNVIDHGMDMKTAVTIPRFHSEEGELIFLEPEIPDDVATQVAALGNDVRRTTYMARVQAIKINADGSLEAGPDPRGGGGVGESHV